MRARRAGGLGAGREGNEGSAAAGAGGSGGGRGEGAGRRRGGRERGGGGGGGGTTEQQLEEAEETLQERKAVISELTAHRDGLQTFLSKLEGIQLQTQDLAVQKADAAARARGLRGMLAAARDTVEAEERTLAAASTSRATSLTSTSSDDTLEAVLRQSVDKQRRALDAQRTTLQMATAIAARREEDGKAAHCAHAAAVRERAELEARVDATETRLDEIEREIRAVGGGEGGGGGGGTGHMRTVSGGGGGEATGRMRTGLGGGRATDGSVGLEQQAAAAAALVLKRRADHRALSSRCASLAGRLGCHWPDRPCVTDVDDNAVRQDAAGGGASTSTALRAGADGGVPGINFHQAVALKKSFEEDRQGATEENGEAGRRGGTSEADGDESASGARPPSGRKRQASGPASKGAKRAKRLPVREEARGEDEATTTATDSVTRHDFLVPLERIFGSVLNIRLVGTTADALECQRRGSRSGARIWAADRIDNPVGSLARRHQAVTEAVRAARRKRGAEGGDEAKSRACCGRGETPASPSTLDLDVRVDGELVDPLALLSWDASDPVATSGA